MTGKSKKLATPCFNNDVTVEVWDQVWNFFYTKMWEYKVLFLERKFHVQIITTTERWPKMAFFIFLNSIIGTFVVFYIQIFSSITGLAPSLHE